MLTKLKNDIDGGLMTALELGDEPLPLLWTCDYIPKNPEGSSRRRESFDFARKPARRPPRKPFAGWTEAENAGDDKTEYVVGEFNCSGQRPGTPVADFWSDFGRFCSKVHQESSFLDRMTSDEES